MLDRPKKFFFGRTKGPTIKKIFFLVGPFLAAIFDRSFIDRSVRFLAHLPLALGSVVRRLQSGVLQRYALAGVIGVLAIIFFLAWRL